MLKKLHIGKLSSATKGGKIRNKKLHDKNQMKSFQFNYFAKITEDKSRTRLIPPLQNYPF